MIANTRPATPQDLIARLKKINDTGITTDHKAIIADLERLVRDGIPVDPPPAPEPRGQTPMTCEERCKAGDMAGRWARLEFDDGSGMDLSTGQFEAIRRVLREHAAAETAPLRERIRKLEMQLDLPADCATYRDVVESLAHWEEEAGRLEARVRELESELAQELGGQIDSHLRRQGQPSAAQPIDREKLRDAFWEFLDFATGADRRTEERERKVSELVASCLTPSREPELEAEIYRLQDDIEGLKIRKIAPLEAKNAKLHEELAEARRQNAQLKDDWDTLSLELDKAKRELTAAQDRADKLTADLEAEAREVERLKTGRVEWLKGIAARWSYKGYMSIVEFAEREAKQETGE